jgi:hypothetical protein
VLGNGLCDWNDSCFVGSVEHRRECLHRETAGVCTVSFAFVLVLEALFAGASCLSSSMHSFAAVRPGGT